MSILGDHDHELTAEERAAIADEARPGVWIENGLDGDGRELTQDQTDALIGRELYRQCPSDQLGTLTSIAGPLRETRMEYPGPHGAITALTQRGGIHSDPLVRLLAFRAWGDRDRRWFERCHEPNCEREAGHSGMHYAARIGNAIGVEWT